MCGLNNLMSSPKQLSLSELEARNIPFEQEVAQ
jgi:hypothetical protein